MSNPNEKPEYVHPEIMSYPMASARLPMVTPPGPPMGAPGVVQPPPYPQQLEFPQQIAIPSEVAYPKQEYPGVYPGADQVLPPQYPGPPVEGKEITVPPPPGLQTLGNEEESHFRSFDFSEQSIRRAFVRKVYAILMCQLIVTVGIMTFFVFHEPTKIWCRRNIWMLGVAVCVAMSCIIAMACSEDIRRKSPSNLIFLGVFTLAESFTLGVVSSTYDGKEVLIAMGVTAAICLALTLFALQTKWDFTMMGGGLLCALVVLITFGSLSFFVYRDMQLRIWLAAAGVFLFSLYLIYDTQLMMGGQHKYAISPEEYVFAALNLYLDIINLFIRILFLLARR